MQWIILIKEEPFELEEIKKIEHYGSTAQYDVTGIQDRYCVDYGEDHIFYDKRNIINDYEKEDLSKIPYKNPGFIMMVYRSEERMREVLQQDNFLNDIYVDNDAGLILPIEEFIALGLPMHT